MDDLERKAAPRNLIWQPWPSGVWWTADTIFGQATFSVAFHAGTGTYAMWYGKATVSEHPSLEDAQSAAQKIYDRLLVGDAQTWPTLRNLGG